MLVPNREPAVCHDDVMRMARLVLAVLTSVVMVFAAGGMSAQAAPSGAEDPALMLVLDSSGSMAEADASGAPRIDAARQALRTVVGELPDEARVGLRLFGSRIDPGDPASCTDSELLVPIASNNHQALAAGIEKYAPLGQTPIGYALQQAGSDLGDSGQRSILLVSDGLSTCDPDPCEVAAELAAGGVDLQINVVGMNVDDAAREQLTCIADAGFGSYFDASDTDSLIAALETLATRAFRPFTVAGTPVEGTATANDAPVLTPGNQYTDTIAAEDDEVLHYLVRREIVGSDLHIGVSALPGNRTRGQLEVRAKTPEGDGCGWVYPTALADNDETWALMTGAFVTGASSAATRESCVHAEELVLTVETTFYDVNSAGVPFEMRIAEEPPIDPAVSLPVAVTDAVREWRMGTTADGSGGEITPGASFNDAPTVPFGSYTADIVPGETQFIAVELDWGQALHAQVRFDQLSDGMADAVGSPLMVRIGAYSPSGGQVNDVFSEGDDASRASLLSRTSPTLISAATPPVVWANRTKDSNDQIAISGTYYLVVSSSSAGGSSVKMPYTITFEAVGTAGEGTPTYLDAPQTSPSAGTPSASPADDQPKEVPDEDQGPSLALIGAAVVVAGLVLGGGGLLLARRLRRR